MKRCESALWGAILLATIGTSLARDGVRIQDPYAGRAQTWRRGQVHAAGLEDEIALRRVRLVGKEGADGDVTGDQFGNQRSLKEHAAQTRQGLRKHQPQLIFAAVAMTDHLGSQLGGKNRRRRGKA